MEIGNSTSEGYAPLAVYDVVITAKTPKSVGLSPHRLAVAVSGPSCDQTVTAILGCFWVQRRRL